MIVQSAIFFFSLTAMLLVTSKHRYSKYGFILGLCGQPFWIYSAWTSEQWGIVTMAIVSVWIRGIWNFFHIHWFSREYRKYKNTVWLMRKCRCGKRHIFDHGWRDFEKYTFKQEYIKEMFEKSRIVPDPSTIWDEKE